MTAIREQIFVAIVEAIRAKLVTVSITRMPSTDPTKFPAIEIDDLGDVPTTGEAGTSRWVLTFMVSIIVQANTGPEAHAAANAIDAEVIEALFVEPVLGGLASEIEADRLQPAVAPGADRRTIAFERTFNLHYSTRRGMPQVID